MALQHAGAAHRLRLPLAGGDLSEHTESYQPLLQCLSCKCTTTCERQKQGLQRDHLSTSNSKPDSLQLCCLLDPHMNITYSICTFCSQHLSAVQPMGDCQHWRTSAQWMRRVQREKGLPLPLVLASASVTLVEVPICRRWRPASQHASTSVMSLLGACPACCQPLPHE